MDDASHRAAGAMLPSAEALAYGPAASDSAGELLQRDRSISEADLRVRLSEGTHICRVAVVEVAATADYLAYVRLSAGRPGYCVIAMRRYEGARSWSDFRTLRRQVAAWGYGGSIVVYPEGHQRLACLGIGGP
ncbi:hypothetical protein [Muricoccus radiodurans]|uniref:hypothetical protein n=1 Tax=Muricoccus radiodurans TaxID=2231721 RepID=UPI003CE6A24B